MSVTGKVHDYAGEQMNHLLTALVFQIHRAAKRPGPDEIHDVRVSIRRFSQGVTLFGVLFPNWKIKKIERRLKRMMKLTSEIRNRDIALEFLVNFKKDELRRRLAGERLGYQQKFREMAGRWTARDFSTKWRTALSFRNV